MRNSSSFLKENLESYSLASLENRNHSLNHKQVDINLVEMIIILRI